MDNEVFTTLLIAVARVRSLSTVKSLLPDTARNRTVSGVRRSPAGPHVRKLIIPALARPDRPASFWAEVSSVVTSISGDRAYQ